MRNYQELVVEHQIQELAPRYPQIASNPGLQKDVACIALNNIKPRYSRDHTDVSRFMTPDERDANVATVRAAVLSAIEFVILNGGDTLEASEGDNQSIL